MRQFAVLRAFDLATAPIDINHCFGLDGEPDQAPCFTSMVRVGFAAQVVPDGRDGWWSREINLSQYNLYRWLLDRGADDGETVLVCWSGPTTEAALRTPDP